MYHIHITVYEKEAEEIAILEFVHQLLKPQFPEVGSMGDLRFVVLGDTQFVHFETLSPLGTSKVELALSKDILEKIKDKLQDVFSWAIKQFKVNNVIINTMAKGITVHWLVERPTPVDLIKEQIDANISG